MKNKKSLACISAIMILVFHLWIPIFNNNILFYIEKYIRYICYIGVDIFFFISAFSLALKNINYKDFIKNRFINIYLKYVILLLIASIYKKYSITKILSILFGYEFITKGGGSFLWFIPAIMFLYLLVPLYIRFDIKYKVLSPILLIIVWLLFSIILSINNDYNAIFIFTNRIPIFMIGYYISKYKIIDYIRTKKAIYIISIIILLILGNFLTYNSYIHHIKISYIYDIFYIINIPLILGIILLIDLMPINKFFNIIGTVTLELYAMQMIFGFRIVNELYMLLNDSLLTNISTFAILFVLSYIFNYVFKKILLIKTNS